MKYNADQLEDWIIITAEIDCSNCKHATSLYNPIDEYEAANHLFEKGWRVTKMGKCYCPNCAKKKLK